MVLEDMSQEKSLIQQEYNYFTVLSSEYGELQNFQEYWHHKDPEEHEVLCTFIPNKSKDMINKGVWRKSKRRNTRPNRCLIHSKWVFRKKRDDQFSACIVTRGYTQIPVVDFTGN